MPLNSLFPNDGTMSERNISENLIIESIRMFGREFYYIPRELVAKDNILGEDNLSRFKNAFMIEGYLDNIDNFGGNGAYLSKFGLTIEEQAQVTISRKRWEELVGQHSATILPNRPCEGDLMYYPLNDGLFEIKFVEHQNPFYQLGKLYVYKLKLELFQYSSERIETDLDGINKFALDMAFNVVDSDDTTLLEEKQASPDVRANMSNRDFEEEASIIVNNTEPNIFGS